MVTRATDGTLAYAMVDVASPLALRVAAELRKEGVMRDLREIAMRLGGGHEADAKDLLANALARVIDPDGDPWSSGTHGFLAHMWVAMRRVRYRQRRRVRKGTEIFDGGVAEERAANDAPRVDDEVDRMRSLAVLRTLGERVLARLGDDALARQLYETALTEDLDPAEEAARFQRTVAEIRAAHERIRYRARLVLDEWNASEERRRKAPGPQATTQNREGTP
jgi:hypothetical protein